MGVNSKGCGVSNERGGSDLEPSTESLIAFGAVVIVSLVGIAYDAAVSACLIQTHAMPSITISRGSPTPIEADEHEPTGGR